MTHLVSLLALLSGIAVVLLVVVLCRVRRGLSVPGDNSALRDQLRRLHMLYRFRSVTRRRWDIDADFRAEAYRAHGFQPPD